MIQERMLQLWHGGNLLTLVLEDTTGKNYQILRLTVGPLSREITARSGDSGPIAVQLLAPYIADGFARRGRRPRDAKKGKLSAWGRGVHHEAALRVAAPGSYFSLFGEMCPDCCDVGQVQRFKNNEGRMVFRFLCCGRSYF